MKLGPDEQLGSKLKYLVMGRWWELKHIVHLMETILETWNIWVADNQWLEIDHDLKLLHLLIFLIMENFLPLVTGYKSSDPNSSGSRDGEGKAVVYSFKNKELIKIGEVIGELNRARLGYRIFFIKWRINCFWRWLFSTK